MSRTCPAYWAGVRSGHLLLGDDLVGEHARGHEVRGALGMRARADFVEEGGHDLLRVGHLRIIRPSRLAAQRTRSECERGGGPAGAGSDSSGTCFE
jgi:hypothetical protein